MAGVFDFAPDTHVAEEIPPEEADAISMNGWEFTSKPAVPYRAKFKLTLSGMRWLLEPRDEEDPDAGMRLDVTTEPTLNAGRLLEFYKSHRKWDTFTYAHEYLGEITCRFAEPVVIPKAIPNADGLVPDFEITLVHHNPGY